MILGIFTFLLEILYFYIILKEFNINKNKDKLYLFISIGILICLSGIILNGSIFRYLFLPLSFWITIKILNKSNSISYLFTILIIFLFKFIIEISTIMLFNGINNILFMTFLFEIICLLFSIIISKYINYINKNILNLWNSSKSFYFRYLFLIVINIFILFIIYNLLKMKEVF